MNKIPVYLCIAILLGQVMLFSSEENMFNPSFDTELGSEDTFPTSGRNHSEDGGWVIETVETSSSQGSWVSHGKYNSLAVGSNGTPHIAYLSAVGNTYSINHTSFNGQTWDSNTVASSSGGPCLALDSSNSPHVGIYTYDSSSNTADFKLATPTGQGSSSWTLEMIDNSSSDVGSNCEIKVGNSMKLKDIPLGTNVHCVELKPMKGAQLARSAGTSARLVAKEGIYATLRLQSGETRKVLWECRATLGTVSNQENNLKSLGKAGAKRWRGVRPTVRGVAMNPVDHPHGGGEGKTSGGRSPVSPWGQSAKGLKTRRPKRSDKLIITRRRKGK